MTLGFDVEKFEHKDSQAGTRAIDLTLIQETNATISMTMESLNRENLALALYGTSSLVAGGTAVDEQVKTYHDLWVSLANIKVSSVLIGDDDGDTPTTTYVLDTDYELNLETGSLRVLSTGAIADGATIFTGYTYAAQEKVEAITTSSAPERWARFEGLNTADTDKPVVIDIYRLAINPLSELSLVNEEIAGMEVEADVLQDNNRLTGSKFFTMRHVA